MPHTKTADRAPSGSGSIRKICRKSTNGQTLTYYQARYTVGIDPGTGKQIQKSICGKSKAEVAKKLREVTTEIDKGTYREPCRLKVGEWLDLWLTTYVTNLRPRTYESYELNVRLHIKPAIGAVKLNELTAEYGYTVMDQHHYYLPTGTPALSNEDIEQMKQQYTLTWYEGDELEQFRGDERFSFALSFSETAPDMLAVTAEKDGMILGMSGASADSDSMWQIGIDVAKEARGQNIGPFLTILLKEEIIRRGKLPFYGTAESHIQSQRVGLKSGFFPAWWEAYSYRNAE